MSKQKSFIGGSYTTQVSYDGQRSLNLFLQNDETGSGKEQEPAMLVSVPGQDLALRMPKGPIRGLHYTAVGPGYQTNPPVLMRIYNAVATPSLAPQVKISEFWITQMGMDWQKPWSHIAAGMGQHCSNVPFGTAIGETSNRGNAVAVPVTTAGSNTAAVVASLGGVGRMTAQVTNIAAAGDNIFFSYQVPAQTATQASKRLVITGVNISATNGGAVIATTPTTLLWGLAWGHTAVSLATADAVGAKAPRHMALGQMYGAIGNVIGQTYDKDILRNFVTPIIVNPGEFVAITVRFLLGTATASQEVVAIVGFEGYWE